MWEIKTIVDADFERDILSELKGTEKYIQYKDEYNSIVGVILELYRKNQDYHFNVLSENITNLL